MNRSLYTLTLCVLASTAAYGMNSHSAQITAQLKNMAQAVGANIKHAAHATCLAAAKTGRAVTEKASNSAHALATNYQTAKTNIQQTYQNMRNSERALAAQALINTTFNTTRIYVKENPAKSVLIVVGAGVIAYKTYTSIRDSIKKALHSWKKHCANHTTFCNCCGRKIAQEQTKYSDPKSNLSDGRHVWICDNCHGYTTYNTNNGKIAYWQARDN